jgi:hypothetical protein
MVQSDDPTARALELARSATLATARRRTALAAVARPTAEVAGLLAVEVLCRPRPRPAPGHPRHHPQEQPRRNRHRERRSRGSPPDQGQVGLADFS